MRAVAVGVVAVACLARFQEVAVITGALFNGAQDVVGFADFYEARGRGGIGGVVVRVVLFGERVELAALGYQ